MKRIAALLVAVMFATGIVQAQAPEGYIFTETKRLPATSVKNQSRSGTCWCYSALSYLESELMREGRDTVGLSEMWIVRHTYYEKAVKYVRMHGEINFDEGGSFADVFEMIRKYGIVPREAYPGLNYGTSLPAHAEMNAAMQAYLDAIIKNPNRTLTTAWLAGLNGILDAYFGKIPENFTYGGRTYTPSLFPAAIGLNPDDYVSITSFTHHRPYTWFAVEIPDNWIWEQSFNVPFDEFLPIIKGAVERDFPVLWGSDVSEQGFQWAKGFAVVPETDPAALEGTDQARLAGLSASERGRAIMAFDSPVVERKIDAGMRQAAFDNYETTDDHGMLVIGEAADQKGNPYFIVKNSWGIEQLYNGYFYASHPFVEYKTINFVVNRNALPQDLLNKMKRND